MLRHPGPPEWVALLLPQEVAIPEGLLGWSLLARGAVMAPIPPSPVTSKLLDQGSPEKGFLLAAEGTWGHQRQVSPFGNRAGSIIFEARCKMKMWGPLFKDCFECQDRAVDGRTRDRALLSTRCGALGNGTGHMPTKLALCR